MRYNKNEDLRNTKNPYPITLDRWGRLGKVELRIHIDTETRSFKIWHLEKLKLTRIEDDGTRVYLNSNGAISYILRLKLDDNRLIVTCDCNRKVEMLCHHAYTALRKIINDSDCHVSDMFLRRSIR